MQKQFFLQFSRDPVNGLTTFLHARIDILDPVSTVTFRKIIDVLVHAKPRMKNTATAWGWQSGLHIASSVWISTIRITDIRNWNLWIGLHAMWSGLNINSAFHTYMYCRLQPRVSQNASRWRTCFSVFIRKLKKISTTKIPIGEEKLLFMLHHALTLRSAVWQHSGFFWR